MQVKVRNEYLVTEVHTAPPQKLQLLLLEAFLRFAEKTRQHWQADETEQASDTLTRCEEIVTEIMAGIRPDGDRELASRVSALYAFVFRCLIEAHLRRDEAKLNQAIAIIELERETWQQVCSQLGQSAPVPAPHAGMVASGLSLQA